MGKLITYLGILIFVDLLFIITGQAPNSLSSVIYGAILNIENFNASTFFAELIGDITQLTDSATGLAALLTTSIVATGFLLSVTDTIKFIPIALTFGLIAGDLIAIGSGLIGMNTILGTLVMAPIIIIYALCVVEWVRGKD